MRQLARLDSQVVAAVCCVLSPPVTAATSRLTGKAAHIIYALREPTIFSENIEDPKTPPSSHDVRLLSRNADPRARVRVGAMKTTTYPGKTLDDAEAEDNEDMFHLLGHKLSLEESDPEAVKLLKQEALYAPNKRVRADKSYELYRLYDEATPREAQKAQDWLFKATYEDSPEGCFDLALVSLYIANEFTQESNHDAAAHHLTIAKDLLERAKAFGHPDADAQLSVMGMNEME